MSANARGPLFHAVIGLLALALLGGCAAAPAQERTPTAQQIANARTRTDHEELAAWYEQEARTAKEKADWHRLMLNESYRPAYGSPYTEVYSKRGYFRHCENLVRRYEEVAQDSLALAQLHRQLATETK